MGDPHFDFLYHLLRDGRGLYRALLFLLLFLKAFFLLLLRRERGSFVCILELLCLSLVQESVPLFGFFFELFGSFLSTHCRRSFQIGCLCPAWILRGGSRLVTIDHWVKHQPM